MDYPKTVSYTHLDVYKRQIFLSLIIYTPLYNITIDEINITVERNKVDMKSKINVM